MVYTVWYRRVNEESWKKLGTTQHAPSLAVVRKIFEMGLLGHSIILGPMYEVCFRDTNDQNTFGLISGTISVTSVTSDEPPEEYLSDLDSLMIIRMTLGVAKETSGAQSLLY